MSKMDKSKFQLEFEMRSVPVALLWNYISSINGLTEWFADEVSISGKTYT
ncbi:START-like domain-containing protein, partial [uncultured Muribaculum sp.]